jgi:hypothetical protein
MLPILIIAIPLYRITQNLIRFPQNLPKTSLQLLQFRSITTIITTKWIINNLIPGTFVQHSDRFDFDQDELALPVNRKINCNFNLNILILIWKEKQEMKPCDNKPCEFDHQKQKEKLQGYRNTQFPSPLFVVDGRWRNNEENRKKERKEERMRKWNLTRCVYVM